MPDEVQQEKKKGGLGSILGMIIIPAVVAFGATFAVLFVLGSNVLPSKKTDQQLTPVPVEIKAVIIQPGTYQTFMLKGGKEVAVIDSLTVTVASDACRATIAERHDRIMDGLMLIFLSKERSELNTVAGIELLKKQIRSMINEVTGFTGDRERLGVIGVYLYIKAISSVE
ncbi:flagellar basal body-associated FliL family protein [Pseudothermotoga thermarum]|uniref:Flagellar protein FliL n=1 Tax=Pseudothermotoga thermarum DSM 5069 TaxID=688269 RepID=F7YW70_9THEM|nr:flagellar basal body-associated FliL family protein [Pseudothermotoga thermarum]AEH51842.1 flagellar basal body-associated protein FliL [Pseudothermotoga thermarum DSM 5069]